MAKLPEKTISDFPARKSKIGRKQNGHARKDCTSKLLGAFQAGQRGKWKSRIRVNGEVVYLKNNEGKTYFHSAEEAHQAYISAAIRFGVNLSI